MNNKNDNAEPEIKITTTNIKDRFGQSSQNFLEEEFKSQTVGLVTREEFKRKRENIDFLIEEDRKKKLEQEQLRKLKEKQERKR